MTNANNIDQQISTAEAQLRNAYTNSQVVKAMNKLTKLNKIQKRIIAIETF